MGMKGARCFDKRCIYNNQKERCKVPPIKVVIDHSGRCMNRKLSDPLG